MHLTIMFFSAFFFFKKFFLKCGDLYVSQVYLTRCTATVTGKTLTRSLRHLRGGRETKMESENTEPTENTIGKVGRPAGLTERQKTFAKFYVEGRHSNAECARMAGYSDKSSITMASKLLNGRDFPDVVELIKELRQAAERKYGVTLMHQLKRLDELSRGAEEAGQYSAAINAEKIRSAFGWPDH